jgi:protein-S-isoprenylcysteine O-methyltransferase Ste14
MRIIWMIVFTMMMAYVAWWLIGSIRKRVVFEAEMALGVGSLWAAIFVPMLFDLPDLVPWPTALSLAGYALLWLGIGLFVVTILSLRQGGKPTSGWEKTTELTTSGIHGLVRHPMQLSGILGACGTAVWQPALVVLVLSAVSVTCFALAARAEDQFNVAKFGESYRTYMEQVPGLNLLAGIWAKLRSRKELSENTGGESNG